MKSAPPFGCQLQLAGSIMDVGGWAKHAGFGLINMVQYGWIIPTRITREVNLFLKTKSRQDEASWLLGQREEEPQTQLCWVWKNV